MDYNQTIQQLGGFGKLKAMVGAHTFIKHEAEKALSFKFKGSRKCNYIKITLDASDTYNVEIGRVTNGKVKGFTYKVIDESAGIYCDQLKPLFESITGLYLSLT